MSLNGDYDIPARGGKEAFRGGINNLEAILPMEQIYKTVLDSPNGPLTVYDLLTVY